VEAVSICSRGGVVVVFNIIIIIIFRGAASRLGVVDVS
jgi:hypothetical protein